MCTVYFENDVEDWFGYGKLNVFSSYKCLMFKFYYLILINNGRTAITTKSDIHSIEYFTQDIFHIISMICMYEYIWNWSILGHRPTNQHSRRTERIFSSLENEFFCMRQMTEFDAVLEANISP